MGASWATSGDGRSGVPRGSDDTRRAPIVVQEPRRRGVRPRRDRRGAGLTACASTTFKAKPSQSSCARSADCGELCGILWMQGAGTVTISQTGPTARTS